MSYRDPKQTIDNTIGIVSQGITNFLRKTTKDIQTFAANKAAQDEAYRKNIEKKIYSSEEQLRTGYLKQMHELDQMDPQTKDEKSFNSQAKALLKNQYETTSAKVDEMMKEGRSAGNIKDVISEDILWQKGFYDVMSAFYTISPEYDKMMENAGGVDGPIDVTNAQTNIALFNYMKLLKDDVEGNVGKFNLFSAPGKEAYITIGEDPSNPDSILNINGIVKEMLKVIKKAQKANLAIDPHLKNFVICPKGKISYVDFCPPYGTEYNKKVINSVHNDYQELVKKNLEFFNAEALGYHFAGDLLKENKNYEAAMPELYKTLCEEEIIDDSISYEEFLSRAKEIKEVELERARKGIFLI